MKTCFTCKSEKDESEFYRRKDSPDGLFGRCVTCVKSAVKSNRIENREYYREEDRKRASLPHLVAARREYARNHPEQMAEYKKKWEKNNPEKLRLSHLRFKENNPEKRAAHVIVGNSLRNGKLVKQPCSVCGETRVEAHHEDYNKPLEVVWLCKPHHVEADKKRREKEMAATA